MGNKLFFVRCEAGENLNLFLDNNIVALGWADVGNFEKISKPEDAKKRFAKEYPELSGGQVAAKASIALSFLNTPKKGDYVITFDRNLKIYYLGIIKSDYLFDNNFINYPHIRKVDWKYELEKKLLTTTTIYSLGAMRTIFEVKDDAMKEILKKKKVIKIKK